MTITINKVKGESTIIYRRIALRSFKSLYNKRELKIIHWINPIEFIGSINNSYIHKFKII